MAKKEKISKANADKVGVIQSVRTKILAVLVAAMAALAICVSVIYINNVREHLMELNQNYLYDLTVAYGEEIEQQIETQGYNTATDYNNLSVTLEGVGIQGVESSYAYLVSADGTMLYHPTKDKVGQSGRTGAVGKPRLIGMFRNGFHHAQTVGFQIGLREGQDRSENHTEHYGYDRHVDEDKLSAKLLQHGLSTSRWYPNRRTASMRTSDPRAFSFFRKNPT